MLLSPFFPAGFYYKTFMWPRKAWKALVRAAIRRAAGLGIAPSAPIPIATRSAMRTATCSSSARAPRASRPPSPPPDRRPRHPVRRTERSSAAACSAMRPRASTDEAALDWVQRSIAELQRNPARVSCFPHHRVRLLPAQPHRFGRAPHRSSRDRTPAHQPRERLWQVRAGRVVLATGAIERPLVFPGNDRPGNHAGGRRANLSQPLRGTGRAPGRARHRVRCRLSIGSRPASRGRGGCRHRRCSGRTPGRIRRKPRATRASRCSRCHRTRHRGRPSGQLASRSGKATRVPVMCAAAQRFDCDVVLMSRRLYAERALVLPIARQAGVERVAASVPAGPVRRSASARPARVAASSSLAQALDDGARAGTEADAVPNRSASSRGAEAEPARLRGRRGARGRIAVAATSAHCRRRTRRAARSPSSTGSTMSPRATLGSPRARAFARSSTSSATRRPAWPPIRARPRISTRWRSSRKTSTCRFPRSGSTTFRMPYTPVTFGSLRRHLARRSVRSRCAPRPRTSGRPRKGAVFENVGLWKRARYFPRARRGHARGGGARMSRRAQRLRPIFDASTLGQDRGRGRGCGRVHESAVHQQLVGTRRGTLALRHPVPRRWIHLRRRCGGAHRRPTAST